jgi:DNA polymerase-3 subunit epsilon
MKIAQQVTRIETIETAGELGALFLESTLVKKYQPLFNRKLRHARKLIGLQKVVTLQGYQTITQVDAHTVTIDQLENIVGIFTSARQIKDCLYELAKQYSLCPKLLGLEKGKGECFSYHLEQCKGACIEKVTPLFYNLKFDEAFHKSRIKPWPFKGPIVIKEKGEHEEHFVVDKWCLLGNIKNPQDQLENLKQEYVFDFDLYKILRQFLRSETNLKKIHSFTLPLASFSA